MNTCYVYILKCADGLAYTGIANNISRRFEEHQKGSNKNCFTYKRRPLELIFQQEFNEAKQAIFFEKKIKNWSAKKKLALAYKEYDMLQIVSECRDATHSTYKLINK